MYRFSFLVCSFLVISYIALSAGVPIDTLKNKAGSQDKFSSLIVGFDYSSFATTDSRLNDTVHQPVYSPYVSFYSKHGLFVSANYNLTGNSDSSLRKSTYSLNLTVGYEWKIGNAITISPSYTHTFYDSKTMLLNRLYSNYADITATYDLTNWSTSLSGSYQWGKISDWLMNLKTSYSFTIAGIFSKKDVLLIQPGVSAQFTNPNYYSKLFSFLNAYTSNKPNAKLGRLVYDIYNIQDRSSYLIDLRQTLRANHDLAYMVRDYMPTGIELSTILSSNNRFTVTSTTVSLPVSYIIGNFTAGISVSLYRTMNQPVYLENQWYTYISGGLNYAINW